MARWWMSMLLVGLTVPCTLLLVYGDECSLTPVVHVLQHPGCVPKPIPSYACVGQCTSYVQVSGSKLWQTERSCMCCQESGEREATVALFCPQAGAGEPRFRRITTRAPIECMCRPCTQLDDAAPIPQEVAGFIESGTPLHAMPFV